MKLLGINVHPVKSTAIRPVTQAQVGRAGLRGDREWMVVDSGGDLVSARELPALFGIVADTPATDDSLDAALRLRTHGQGDLLLDRPTSPRQLVRVHHVEMKAVPAGAEADGWVRAATGRDDLSLVWCDDPTQRSLNPAWSEPGDHAAFPDSAPLTLASPTSLDQVNEWLAETALEQGETTPEPLPINRFRANVVVGGISEPFAEDAWSHVRIGNVPFRVAAPVDRCVMTTIEPGNFTKGKEPIRTLARHRKWGGKTWFAVKLLPDGEGTIRVGDEVTAP